MTNVLKTTVLLATLTALLLLIGHWVGGQQGMILAFGVALLMNFFSYWFSDKIVLAMYGARPVSPSETPKLYQIVQRLADNAGIPMPKVYLVPSPQPNAFATGRDPHHAAVAATEGILRLLNEDELEAVLAHEIAHVVHRDTLISTIAATLAGAIMMLAHMARWAIFFGGYSRDREERGGGIGLLVMAILAPLAATLIQLAISRAREFMADEGSAKLTGKPLALANALLKLERGAETIPMEANPATAHMFIVNPLRGESLFALFSTHPPTEARVQRLQKIAQQMGYFF